MAGKALGGREFQGRTADARKRGEFLMLSFCMAVWLLFTCVSYSYVLYMYMYIIKLYVYVYYMYMHVL